MEGGGKKQISKQVNIYSESQFWTFTLEMIIRHPSGDFNYIIYKSVTLWRNQD